MDAPELKSLRLSDSDLDFVIREAAPDFGDKEKLKRLIREDDAFRKALLGDEKVFRRLMADEDVFVKVSPALYFEVLLRRTLSELKNASYTIERIGTEQVPVFDVESVVNLLANEALLEYLVDMLCSFTRIESYTIPIRVRKGVWRKFRFSDIDIDALIQLCQTLDEEHKFSLYKRIGDVCLFILGIFPEYAQFDYQYHSSRGLRLRLTAARRGMQEYEEEGRRFYRLAAEHRSARELELSEVFELLDKNFNTAKKPLNFISQCYLRRRKYQLFDVEN
ncbi:MAG: hypothetical protein QXQ53_08620 [Candidatus Methanosuratincola sp.]